jgi:hypothetical protein
MSFSMTTEAVRDRSKTVTRRLGWWNLQPGTILQAVEKAQGLEKGEHVKPICVIRVVSVHPEDLRDIKFYANDTAREGFPELSPWQFVEMFDKANGCGIAARVNRIEFEYVAPSPVAPEEDPE